ncbi:uncharacterized protein TNCV_4088831 [Trichonephila clavipes]|nr:uncharacterized protein TNCV_4088831 [Trichonephila clavipes]
MQISAENLQEELDLRHLENRQIKKEFEKLIQDYKPEKTASTEVTMRIILEDEEPVCQPPRRALDWFEFLGSRFVEDKATDYAHLKQALSEQFPVVRNRSELETRFYSSSQKHNQKPSDFVYDLLKIHKILKLEMTEEKLIDHIISTNRQDNWRETRDNNRYADNSRPRREFNRFESKGVVDNQRFDGRRRGGQSDHRFHNQGGRQGGSRNSTFRDDQIKQLPKVEKPVEIDLSDRKLGEGQKQKLRNLFNGFKGLFSDQPGLTHVLYYEIDTGDKGRQCRDSTDTIGSNKE